MIAAAAAAAQSTRAAQRTVTVLDDLTGWGTQGVLPAEPPAPVYVPAGTEGTYGAVTVAKYGTAKYDQAVYG